MTNIVLLCLAAKLLLCVLPPTPAHKLLLSHKETLSLDSYCPVQSLCVGAV
jgi:hypothetical protein